MIEDNFDKFVDVKRLMDDSGNTETYDDHIDDLPCTIQPLDESYSQDIDGNFGKDSLMFCDVADILEGDRIVDGATEYKVIGVESFEFLGQPRHMELRIRKSNK
jgi:hypothetical protein